MRATTSLAPPAANGTLKATGRGGKACALAICETAGSAAAPAARRRNFRRDGFIPVSPRRVAIPCLNRERCDVADCHIASSRGVDPMRPSLRLNPSRLDDLAELLDAQFLQGCEFFGSVG